MDTTLTLLINGSHNVYLDAVAMLATKAWIWIPLYGAIIYVLVREHNFRQLCYIVGAVVLVLLISDQVASGICKPLVARYRPSHDPSIMHLVDTVNGYRGGQYGFFSSHASNTASIATLLSLLFRRKATSVALILWSVLNCWTRIYLGVHFLSDIVVGLLFGMAVGFVFYRLLIYCLKRANELWGVAPPHYSATRLSTIETTFILTLVIITIPWKIYL